jgi:hypothetical protein
VLEKQFENALRIDQLLADYPVIPVYGLERDSVGNLYLVIEHPREKTVEEVLVERGREPMKQGGK